MGKSTLFNKIVGARSAIVDDMPGVTRDRNIAITERENRRIGVIDTGGFEPESKELIMAQAREQAMIAIEEADVIFLVVDGVEGMNPVDEEIARVLRKSNKPVRLVVNKIDNPGRERNIDEFNRLGFDTVHAVSAEHSIGVETLLEEVALLYPEEAHRADDEKSGDPVQVAVVGKPNVGKSSLVNSLIGADRMMVSDAAGTTRDAVDSDIVVDGKRYTIIDTAGIRRKARVTQKLEKYSVIMAMKAIERADVVMLVIDATDGVAAQEAKIGSLVEDAGKGCVIVVNKWDAIEKDDKSTLRYEEVIRDQLAFLAHAPIVFVSAVTGQRLENIWGVVDDVYAQCNKRIGSGRLNRLMESFIKRKPLSMYHNKRVKIYYATQASVRPPTFVFMSNLPKGIHFSYKRYLANRLREDAGFDKSPVRMIFRKPPGRRTEKR